MRSLEVLCRLPRADAVPQVRVESFDFAAIKLTHAVCPTTPPNPVYRLFNNKTATNPGNHRYVVSVTDTLNQALKIDQLLIRTPVLLGVKHRIRQ